MKATYLEKFNKRLEKYKGSLVRVNSIKKLEKNAKEYLNKLAKIGKIEKVCWGWYYIPEKKQDVWDFLARDKGFKIIIKQTAASFWNYDFVHRNIYHLAVKDKSYKRALEEFGKKRRWIFEVECHEDIESQFRYEKIDGLFVECPESCLIGCVVDWSFLDAFSILYFMRNDVSLDIVKELGMWKRISRTDARAWNVVDYACFSFNKCLNKKIFATEGRKLKQDDIKELVEEAVEKVIEFA